MKLFKLFIVLFIPILVLSGCGRNEYRDTKVTIDTSIESRKNSIGKSDKDVKNLTGYYNEEIRNDKTGNWRYFSYPETEDFLPYVLSNGKGYIKNKEIHYVMSFGKNILYIISDVGPYYDVKAKYHVEGEEHDASTIGEGTTFGHYLVYKDNGDLEQLKLEN